MLTLALIAAQALDAPAPETFAVAVPGAPAVVGDPTGFEMRGHDVRVELGSTEATYYATSEIRYGGDEPRQVRIQIPVRGQGIDLEGLSALRVRATIGQDLVALSERPRTAGVRVWEVTTTFRPRSTQGLRVMVTVPVGTAGDDRKQRVVAYDLGPIRTYEGETQRLNFAIQYRRERFPVGPGGGETFEGPPVFKVTGTWPRNGWQIGPRGAFLKLLGGAIRNEETLAFTYYPNGYDR